MNMITMVSYVRHCPCRAGFLFLFERNERVIILIIKVCFQGALTLHRILVSTIELSNFHNHTKEVFWHVPEGDTTHFNGVITDDATPLLFIFTLGLQKMLPVGNKPGVFSKTSHASSLVVEDCPPWSCIHYS